MQSIQLLQPCSLLYCAGWVGESCRQQVLPLCRGGSHSPPVAGHMAWYNWHRSCGSCPLPVSNNGVSSLPTGHKSLLEWGGVEGRDSLPLFSPASGQLVHCCHGESTWNSKNSSLSSSPQRCHQCHGPWHPPLIWLAKRDVLLPRSKSAGLLLCFFSFNTALDQLHYSENVLSFFKY